MDDPSIEVAISEPKVIYAMKIFENELQQLRDDNAAMGEVDREYHQYTYPSKLTVS
jgi:hypothetical protein